MMKRLSVCKNLIIYLECNSKNQLINPMLESVFKCDIPKVTSYKNSNTLLAPNDDFQFPKRFRVKTTINKVLVTVTLMIIDFMLFLLMTTWNENRK